MLESAQEIKIAVEGRTYKCPPATLCIAMRAGNICGQAVKVEVSGVGTLVYCNQPMELREAEINFNKVTSLAVRQGGRSGMEL